MTVCIMLNMCDYHSSEIDSQLAVKLLHLSQLNSRRISVKILEVFKRCIWHGLLFLRTNLLRFWKYSKRKVEGWQWKQMTGVRATVQSNPKRMNQGSTIIYFSIYLLNKEEGLSFVGQRLQQLSASRAVVQLLQPPLHAFWVHQAAAAGQGQCLFWDDFLEADLALRLVLKKSVREMAIRAVFVYPSQDLPFFCSRVTGGRCLSFAFAADADEDMDQDYAGEEGDVGICNHRIISIVFEHPALAVGLSLAGKLILSAAMFPINLPSVFQRTNLQAGEVGGILWRNFCLVEGDGSGGIHSNSEYDDEYEINNNDDCTLPRGGEFGTEAGLTGRGVI